MPFGISLTGGKPASKLRLASHASVQELRPHHRQRTEQLQQQSMAKTGQQPEFRLAFLGKQALSRPNSTGFGSVQKPLKEIYLSHLVTSKEGGDRPGERTVSFHGPDMQLQYRDAHNGQQQRECYPLDAVAYIDLVLFQTIKGKKRHFGYFRRHTDSTDVVPDSVLIPLHKKDHRAITKARHRPMLCFIVRRPYGIQFLECHVYQVDSEQAGAEFIREFDSRSLARQEAEKRSNFGGSQQPQQQQQQPLNKWSSQPLLLKATPSLSAASDLSEAPATPNSSTASSRAARQPAVATTTEQPRPTPRPAPRQSASKPSGEADNATAATDGDSESGHIRRSASGTIFEKYKELEVFNIPEYEYMGFQELQQIRIEHKRQLGGNSVNTGDVGNSVNAGDVGNSPRGPGSGGTSRIPVSLQPSQRPPRPPPQQQQQRETPPAPVLPPRNSAAGNGGVSGSAKFPSDGNLKARQQQQQQEQRRRQQQQQPAGRSRERQGQPAGRFELPPTPPIESADAAKPVARVVPTARPLPCPDWRQQQQQQQPKTSVNRSNSAAVSQPHRVHHRSGGSSRVSGSQQQQQQQQQQRTRLRPMGGSARGAVPARDPGSGPDFATALGYLP